MTSKKNAILMSVISAEEGADAETAMPVIRYNHNYTKFRGCIHDGTVVILVHSCKVNEKELPRVFLDHDTHYTIDGKAFHYPLAAGADYLLLVLYSPCHNLVYTTLRAYNKAKERYYKEKIGEGIRQEIEESGVPV